MVANYFPPLQDDEKAELAELWRAGDTRGWSRRWWEMRSAAADRRDKA